MTGLPIAGALAAELVWFSFVKEMETADRRQRTLVPLPSSADRNPSPPKVSRKREFFRIWLETFGRFSPKLPILGFRRLVANAQKCRKLQAISRKNGAHLG